MRGFPQIIDASPLPGQVKEYLLRASLLKTRSPIKTAAGKDPAKFIIILDDLLTAAGAALGCSREEVLFVTGFNKNDFAPGRFAAALAELRAAVFLAGEGFTGLTLLRQQASLSTDLAGARAGRDYVFEVRCITAGAARLAYLCKKNGAPRPPGPDAVKYLRLKYEKKIRQVNCTRRRTGREHGGIIFALELDGPADQFALGELAAALHLAKNSPPFTRICLIAGETGAVYPAW